MRHYFTKLDLIMIIVTLIIGSALPSLLGLQYYILLALQALLFATIVLAWNIVGGYAGQLDLASFTYMPLGGIIACTLLERFGVSPWIGMIVGALASMALAVCIGYPMFRFGVIGVYYALSTAALTVIVHELMILLIGPWDFYLPPYEGWYYLRFKTWENLYYFVLAVFIVAVVVNIIVSRSRLGYYLKAIREDELAAESLGIDTRKYKLLALLIYSGMLGFIGWPYIVAQRTYSAWTFSIAMSIYVITAGIVGGRGSIVGVVVAAIMLKLVEEILRGQIGGVLPGSHLLVSGILLVTISIVQPRGLKALFERVERPIRARLEVM